MDWPEITYDDGYPEDEEFTFWSMTTPPLSMIDAAAWLIRELPEAAKCMPCHCEIVDSTDTMDRPCKLINFSTWGWSGAERIVDLIDRRPDMKYFMLSWQRGGHYVFEIPARYLPPAP